MSSSWFITNLISAFLLPPLIFLLPGAGGLLLWHQRPQLARALVTAALALLWICSTPYFSGSALRLLESHVAAIDARAAPAADAIVVLGAGTYFHAPEYGADTVSEPALVRLRYAASLQRATGKPVLVTGGSPLGNGLSEAQQMKSVLEREFNIPVRWTEDASDNTLENARYSYRLLHQAGIKRIYLVTHAWHMPRAVLAFRQAGFEVVPAPTAYTTRFRTSLLDFVPSAEGMIESRIFLHEAIGIIWYLFRTGYTEDGS
jgi:uncharacterized SAM-binding protein YcdF (DUF218 family)